MKKNTFLTKITIIVLFFLTVISFKSLGQTTQITASQCGATLVAIGTNIYADGYSGATKYRFRAFDGTNTYTIDKTSRYFNLTQLPTCLYNTAYTIDVALEIGGVFKPYGSSCIVRTPNYAAKLTTAYCDTTLPLIGTTVYANYIYGATKYRYKVSDGLGNTQYLDRTTNNFNFTQLGTFKYNTKYTVYVSVELGGVFGSYGSACNVTTPNYKAELLPAYCDTVLTKITTTIYATYVYGATKYRYKIDDEHGTIQYLDRTTNNFNFTQLTSFEYSTPYKVSVAVELNGVFGSYGTVCTVTTPNSTTSNILPEYCDNTLSNIETNVVSSYVFGATKYKFKIDDGTTIQTLDRTVSRFSFTQFASFNYNTTYIVSVAVELDSVFGDYGSSCLITTPGYITQIAPEYCDTVLPTITTNVYARFINGATKYRFKIDDGTAAQTIEHSDYYFNFTQFPSFKYATTYSVSVSAFADGEWGDFGTACNITTAVPNTKIISTQCGFTIQNTYYDTLFADVITDATLYTFTIINGTQQESISSSNRFVRPSDFTTLQYNTTYKVIVKATLNGIIGSPIDTCNISTTTYPWTTINAAQCNATIASVTNRIYAVAVTGITDYQFRIVNGAETQYLNTGNVRNFLFNTLPNYKFGTTYSIDISLKYNGVYQPYGPVCSITTPPFSTKIQTSQCGTTLPTIGTTVYADFIFGLIDGQYRFRISKNGSSQILEKSTQKFKFTEIAGYTLGATYTVDVQVRHNGIWGEYGVPCNITLPAAKTGALAIDNSTESSDFSVNVAPNPFTNTFRINLSDEQIAYDKIDILLYNTTGQLIERYNSNSESINSINIGESCAKGIYILKVVSGNKISINKLVKE